MGMHIFHVIIRDMDNQWFEICHEITIYAYMLQLSTGILRKMTRASIPSSVLGIECSDACNRDISSTFSWEGLDL
jgi:hypothetical protein